MSAPKWLQTIADATGAQMQELNPLEGLTDDQIADGQDYFTVMRQNLEKLEKRIAVKRRGLMNVLEAKDLSFAYGNTPVLDAASFTMCEGGFAALVGVNGAGKSTLLRLLLGELKPTGGHIALMGQDIGSFKSWQRIGYVPQDGLTRKESFPASVKKSC